MHSKVRRASKKEYDSPVSHVSLDIPGITNSPDSPEFDTCFASFDLYTRPCGQEVKISNRQAGCTFYVLFRYKMGILLKNKTCNSPFWGDVGIKSGLRFFVSAPEVPFFGT